MNLTDFEAARRLVESRDQLGLALQGAARVLRGAPGAPVTFASEILAQLPREEATRILADLMLAGQAQIAALDRRLADLGVSVDRPAGCEAAPETPCEPAKIVQLVRPER